MRHKEREIADRGLVDALIRSCTVMRLALSMNDQPYLVPVCFGYDGTSLFFHTGLRGQKIDFLRANPRVCFEFEEPVRPLPHDSLACKWGFAYRTVIGTGLARELGDAHDRNQGLREIMRQYSADPDWEFDGSAMAVTRVWRIEIDSMAARQSKRGWDDPAA